MKALARYQVIVLGEQRHIRCEQLAQGCCPNTAAVESSTRPIDHESNALRLHYRVTKMVYLETVTHPSINRARRRVTPLIKTNALPLSQATTCQALRHLTVLT